MNKILIAPETPLEREDNHGSPAAIASRRLLAMSIKGMER